MSRLSYPHIVGYLKHLDNVYAQVMAAHSSDRARQYALESRRSGFDSIPHYLLWPLVNAYPPSQRNTKEYTDKLNRVMLQLKLLSLLGVDVVNDMRSDYPHIWDLIEGTLDSALTISFKAQTLRRNQQLKEQYDDTEPQH